MDNSLFEEPKPVPFYKTSLFIRAMGFVLVGAALLLMMNWQKGILPPYYRKVSFGLAAAGLLVYISGRAKAFSERKKRKSAGP